MLSGVLLHMIESAGPLDATFDGAGGEFLVDDVDDVAAFIADVEDVGFGEEADVMRLAAGSGIEGGLVEDDFPGRNRPAGAGDGGAGLASEDAGFEVLEVGIVVIESMSCHGVRGNFSMGILEDGWDRGDEVEIFLSRLEAGATAREGSARGCLARGVDFRGFGGCWIH